LVNVTQQIGGSIGVALLNSIAIATATAYVAAQFGLSGGEPGPNSSYAGVVTTGTLHGYSVAFWVAAAFFGVGAVVALLLLPSGVPRIEAVDDEPVRAES
jgi:hypothetical protein